MFFASNSVLIHWITFVLNIDNYFEAVFINWELGKITIEEWDQIKLNMNKWNEIK